MYPIKLARYALSGWLPGGRRHCIVCNRQVWRFMPYRRGSRSLSPLTLALSVVGSDVDNFECPRCGAHDRERHLLMYLQAGGLLPQLSGARILHFAPEKHLARKIAALAPVCYVKCDLSPQAPDVKRVDMLAMPFEHESFDFLIANHVLEHVDDDLKALSEIRRVLVIGGHAILQTPYSPRLHRTWQDPGIDDEQTRWQAYGQEDHVRLYGRDIFARFASVGLQPMIGEHNRMLSGVDAVTAGVNSREPLFLFRRDE